MHLPFLGFHLAHASFPQGSFYAGFQVPLHLKGVNETVTGAKHVAENNYKYRGDGHDCYTILTGGSDLVLLRRTFRLGDDLPSACGSTTDA
jgi:hypothetical protein